MAEVKSVQKTNRNGRGVLVIDHEKGKKAAALGSNVGDQIGYLVTGVKVFEKNNFHWGLLDSKTVPTFSKKTLENILKFKMYEYDYDTKRVFQGNQHVNVSRVSDVVTKLDHLASTASLVSDGIEIAIAIEEKDASALAKSSSKIALSRVGERAGIAAAGVCTKAVLKTLKPHKIALAGAACYGALTILGSEAGEKVGEKVGATSTAKKAAELLINVLENTNKQDEIMEEKRKQKEIEKDPMSEWHIINSD